MPGEDNCQPYYLQSLFRIHRLLRYGSTQRLLYFLVCFQRYGLKVRFQRLNEI
jgi:hypothetical protein